MKPRGVAASSLKLLCKKFNPVKNYAITHMTVFVLSLWENTGMDLLLFASLYINFIC